MNELNMFLDAIILLTESPLENLLGVTLCLLSMTVLVLVLKNKA